MPPKSQNNKKKSKCSTTRKPHFFKVLLGDFTERLRIPPNFLKHIPGAEPRKAVLQGPSGSNWHVEVGKTIKGKGTFLTTGWRKFAKDHSLREHEFLVFQYDGDMHFTVLIFDTTACEREDAFGVRPWRRPAKCEGGGGRGGRRKRGRPSKRSLEVSCVVKQEATQHALSLKLVKSYLYEPNPLQIQLSQGADRCLPSAAAAPPPKCDVKVKREETEEECDQLPITTIRAPSKRYRKQYTSTRRPVTEEERLKAQEAANAFTSAFPYLVIRMAATHIYRPYMRVPMWFSRAYLPHKRTSLVLRDPTGKSWVVNYIPSSRCQISGGWTAFARTNKLEEGDYCAFELVGPVELRVHIFRVVEETLPITIYGSNNLVGIASI